ncbi:MAG: hypothetical protein CMB53_03890 [Euryarchaeota archaeon]|nr:hypothetical protein [Euryarchaeota archaeon]|tara:strand:+ start:19568 stop:20419 length:852 start_codon:yes stop_codon:yes gene_type:complete
MEGKREVIAPVRVDLAGGWTDVPPYTEDFGGEVVNFTINRYVKATSNDSSVSFSFGVPSGSGLGSSGAMNVARAALSSPNDTPEDIAERAYQIEARAGNLGGRQDQWASALGGFNHLIFFGERVERMPFEPMRSSRAWLHKHLLLVNSGISRKSGNLHGPVWSRYSEGDKDVIEGLHAIRSAVRGMATGLQQDRRDLIVDSMRRTSEGVDAIDRGIHEPFRETFELMVDSGMVSSWKAVGAGGGGFAALICHPSATEDVRKSLKSADWDILDWDYEDEGFQIL